MASERGPKKARWARRKFSDEFKAGAVRLVIEEGRPIAQVAVELDLTETALREWVRRAREGGAATALSASEREELTRLRRELRQVKIERDILKKAAAFFANQKR